MPYGPKYTAKKIQKLLFTKDLLLNAEWNKPEDRETKFHRPSCYLRISQRRAPCLLWFLAGGVYRRRFCSIRRGREDPPPCLDWHMAPRKPHIVDRSVSKHTTAVRPSACSNRWVNYLRLLSTDREGPKIGMNPVAVDIPPHLGEKILTLFI